jgi:hypothetical protein
MNFFTKAILGSVVVLLVAVAAVFMFRSKEGARVEALLRDAVAWAEQGDAARVSDLVDDQFEDGADGARLEIRRRIRPGAFEKIEIVDLDVGVDGEEAHARIVLRVQAREVPMPVPQTFNVALRKREAGWRVVQVRQEGRLR